MSGRCAGAGSDGNGACAHAGGRVLSEARGARFEMLRWSIFLVLVLSYVLVYFHRMAPGVIADDLMRSFGSTGTALGALAAAYFIVYAAMQIPAGMLADRLGPRVTVTAGNVIAGIGSILFGTAGSFDAAVAGRFLVGFGVSVVFIGTLKSNSRWFEHRRFAFMSGMTGFIGNMGSVLSAGPLAVTLTVYSWRSVFCGLGAVSLALGAAAWLVIRNRPEDAGFSSPDGISAQETETAVPAGGMAGVGSVATTRGILPGFWVNFGVTGGIFAFMGLWGMPFLRDTRGLGKGEASGYMTVMLLAFTAGILFFGWLADHIGKRKPIIVFSAALHLAVWCVLVYAPWKAGAFGYLLFIAAGFAGAGPIVTFAAAKESVAPALTGTAASFVNTGTFIATLIMQPLIGKVLDMGWSGAAADGVRIYSTGDYTRAFTLIVLLACIGIVGACRLRGRPETGGKRV